MKQHSSFENIYFGVVIGLASIYLFNSFSAVLDQNQAVLGVQTTEPAPIMRVLPTPTNGASDVRPVQLGSVPCASVLETYNRYCLGRPLPVPSIGIGFSGPTPTVAIGTTGIIPTRAPTNFTFQMTPPTQITPNARGAGNGTIARITNDFYNFTVSVRITSLVPSKNYKMWLCGSSGDCNTSATTAFTTDASGNGTISGALISNNQTNNAIRIAKIWQVSSGTGTDVSSCPMISFTSTPCLQATLTY